MKKFSLLFVVVAMTLFGCEQGNSNEFLNSVIEQLPQLPQLPDVEETDDLCDKMDDMVFIAYCRANFDANKDGVLSLKEAETVREVNLGEIYDIEGKYVYSVKGIEYFKNLNKFDAGGDGNYAIYSELLECDLRYNENLTEIDFQCCTKLKKVQLPNMEKIGNNAFSNCTSLTSITIPDSVTSIGEYTFYNCTSLTSVTIGKGVTSIGSNAFQNCTSLTIVTIPDSVTEIGTGAFKKCNSLKSATIGDGVISIGDEAFCDCPSLVAFYGKLASDDNRCLIIGGKLQAYAFAGTIQCVIPDNVTYIGNKVFCNCSSLASITIPQSVEVISPLTFSGCRGVLVVNCNISHSAFKDSKFSSVTIGDNVSSIGSYAFYNCDNLSSVTIPEGVTEIGSSAFDDCKRITSVYCMPKTPPMGGYNMFRTADEDLYFHDQQYTPYIYVHIESVEAYMTADYWREIADYIVGYDF